MKGSKLSIPSSSEVSSLLFDPLSHSAALTLTNSSTLLFPSLPISSQSQSQYPPIPIPPPISSSCFLHLRSRRRPARVAFVAAGPIHGGSRVLIRAWIMGKNGNFARAELSAGQRDLVCDGELGAVFDGAHGVSCELKGSVNVFVMNSVSARKVWVFAARVVGEGEEDEEDGARVRLMKCAVIDCVAPICSVFVSSGFLMLGEESGVRVFPLRLLVKGEVRDKRDCKLNKSQGCGFKCGASCDCSRLQNGVIESVCESKSATVDGSAKTCSNGIIQKAGVNSNGARRTLRLKQDSSNCGIIFVTFSTLQDQSQTSKSPFFSLKSTSIHALSEKIFVVLDSAGDLHLLNLYNTFPGSEISGKMRHLKSTMKVQMLAVFPDVSTKTQTLWISDGFYSVHILPITELDIPLDELDEIESEEKRMQNSATQAIFASEKIQNLIPISANSIILLGQGSVFAYAIS